MTVYGERSEDGSCRLGQGYSGAGEADVLLLAGSTRDLLNVLATLSEREAASRSLNDQGADTATQPGG
jgi:hypothetical protein